MNDITLTAQQQDGIAAITNWYRGWADRRHKKQVFFLTGAAGTGKTSLARAAAAQCVPEYAVVYIAPTGKAASVLRKKGCRGAKTFHQFVYNPRGEDEEGELIFAEKEFLKETPRLVVMDEGSMISAWDMEALLRHNIAVLALGDLQQVDPVKGSAYLTADAVDFKLTEILRQAEGSNIIRAAGFVAQGKRLPLREYSDVRVRDGKPPIEELVAHSGEDAIIICSYNNTRQAINRKVREALGFTGAMPNVGEKVMCWFNQHSNGFMNGEQGIVLGFEEIPPHDEDAQHENAPDMVYMKLRSLSDGKTKRVLFNPLSFSDDEDVQKAALKAEGGFQFGFVGTVHKTQGSEWQRVLVVEEKLGDYAKMNYTAYTRAQEVLTVYRPNGRY